MVTRDLAAWFRRRVDSRRTRQKKKTMTRIKTCIVPATIPGFFALEVVEDLDGGPLTVDKAPVVAWRIQERVDDNDRDEISQPLATPICAREVQWFAVLTPDGTVTGRADYDFPSLDAWVAYETEMRRKGREQYAAKQAPKLAAKAAAPAQQSVPLNPFALRDANNNKTLSLPQRRGPGV